MLFLETEKEMHREDNHDGQEPLSIEMVKMDLPSPKCFVSISHLEGKRVADVYLMFEIDTPDLVPPYGHIDLLNTFTIGSHTADALQCMLYIDKYSYSRQDVFERMYGNLDIGKTVIMPMPLPQSPPGGFLEHEYTIPRGCSVALDASGMKNVKVYLKVIYGLSRYL